MILSSFRFASVLSLLLPLSAGALELDFTGIDSVRVVVPNGATSASVATAPYQVNLDPSCSNGGLIAPTVEKLGGLLLIQLPESTISCGVSLTLPPNLPLRIENGNGATSVTGLYSLISISAKNGPVTLSDTTGAVNATLENVTFKSQTHTGTLNVASKNGGISVRDLTLPSASTNQITTKNGSIRISGLKVLPNAKGKKSGIKIKARTSNGSVRVPSLRREGSYRIFKLGRSSAKFNLVTQNGDVVVRR